MASNTASNQIPRFKWVDKLDLILLKEIHFQAPYQFKAGSEKSAECWTQILQTLNTCYEKEIFAGLTTKRIQDHFNHLIEKRQEEKKKEDKASGINVELPDKDKILDDIFADRKDHFEHLKEQENENKAAEEKKKEKGEDVRLKAMEKLGDTRKRKQDDGDETTPARNPRRSGNDTFAFLAERSEERKIEKEKEMELKRQEMETRTKQSESTNNAMIQMMQVMQQQLQAQQAQAQQQYQMQQQQQQQNMMLFNALIDKLSK